MKQMQSVQNSIENNKKKQEINLMHDLKHGDLIWLWLSLLLTYFSWIKFAIASRTAFFTGAGHIDVVLYHFVDLNTELLVYLISNDSGIDKEGN